MPSFQDEFGTVWHVKPGDPAHWQALALGRQGFDIVVLPRYNYMYGTTSTPLFEPGDVIYACRLADCMKVASEPK